MSEIPRIGEVLEEQRQAWKQRVLAERDEVKSRVDRLDAFIQSAEYYKVSDGEKGLLSAQLSHMRGYLAALNSRVEYHKEQT